MLNNQYMPLFQILLSAVLVKNIRKLRSWEDESIQHEVWIRKFGL